MLPAPPRVWQPPQQPPVGEIRTDGQSLAVHLPASAQDWAPWHQAHPDGRPRPPLTHRAVDQWRVVTALRPPGVVVVADEEDEDLDLDAYARDESRRLLGELVKEGSL